MNMNFGKVFQAEWDRNKSANREVNQEATTEGPGENCWDLRIEQDCDDRS